ncbi:MAG: GNAT family N-acetyltransferase [Nocardioides sp.]
MSQSTPACVAGLLQYVDCAGEREVMTLSTSRQRHGVGRALMQRCLDDARSLGIGRVWLTTTNDNIAAIAFYQRIGMDLCAFRRHGVRVSRRVKPRSLHDETGVAIEHELEFEWLPGG